MSKIVETRVGAETSAYHQFIHGTQYIDELVMMRVKDKGGLYVHQDANWNVIGLTDMGGSLVERYVNTPYGIMTVNQETGYGDRDGDGDGDVDSTDKGTPGTPCTGTVSGACRILDLDFDGDYDSADAALFDSLPQGVATHPGRIATGVAQPFGHQGLLFEPEVRGYQNRARHYDPGKRRFVQRDPLALLARARSGYQDGMNLNGYQGGNPLRYRDPSGRGLWDLFTCACTCLGCGGAYACVFNVHSDCNVGPGHDKCIVDCEDDGRSSEECVAHCHPPGGGFGPEGGEGFRNCRDDGLADCTEDLGADLCKCADCVVCSVGLFFEGFDMVSPCD